MKEQTFFPDAIADRLLGVVFSLAAEVYILRDRLNALEKVLEQNGTMAPDAVEGYAAENQPAHREAFINSILEPLLSGQQAASNIDERYVRSLL